MDGKEGKRPVRRLTQARRDKFLEVLGQTGNRRMAAEAIGFEPRLMDQRRQYDALLDRQWIERLEQADRRLAGIEGPYDPALGDAPVVVVKRGSNGRLMLQKAGEKRWSRTVEDRFFATLAMCGNIGASARAVGFSQSCIDQRRRKWPDFARRMEEVLEDAEVEIEFRMAAEIRGVGGDSHFSNRGHQSEKAARESDCPQAACESGRSRPLDMDSAMRFLKWRQEKKAGRGRRGRVPAPPSIEAVTEKIVKRVEAIKRHRARGGLPPAAGTREGDAQGGQSGDGHVTVTADRVCDSHGDCHYPLFASIHGGFGIWAVASWRSTAQRSDNALK